MFNFFHIKKSAVSDEAAAVSQAAPVPTTASLPAARFIIMPSAFLPSTVNPRRQKWIGIVIVSIGVLILIGGGIIGFRFLIQTPVVEIDTTAPAATANNEAAPVPVSDLPTALTPTAARTLRAEVRDASGLTASTGRLLIPEDALKEISRLELIGENIAQPETETTIGLLISGRYRILPADTQFQREVNLVIDYSALVSTALAEKDLVGAVNVKGEWSKDPGAIVDPVTKTVTFSIQAMPAPAYAILVTKPAESKTDAIVGDKKLPTLTERLALGPDTDGDKLSDEEEVIYGVDARRPDTDTDGFLDGLEVMSLYNPRVAGNVTLADSGLVQRLEQTEFSYSLLYPARFLTRYLDDAKRELLISTATGEFFEILVQDNPGQLPTRAWVEQQFPDQDVVSLRSSTIDDVFAIWAPDDLTVYAARGPFVYTISYSPGTITRLNFVTTFEMLVKSMSFKIE